MSFSLGPDRIVVKRGWESPLNFRRARSYKVCSSQNEALDVRRGQGVELGVELGLLFVMTSQKTGRGSKVKAMIGRGVSEAERMGVLHSLRDAIHSN